jgi:hypothetical protein
MLGIGTKPAKLLAAAALAIGIGAAGVPATVEAGDDHRRHGGRGFHGHQKHFKHGHHGRGDFRRHHGYRHHGYRHPGHSGVVVHIWRPQPHVPAVQHHWVTRPCHPVVGHGLDAYGRQAKFGGTMCYDRFGNGYVVAGSQHVIHYF